MNFEAFGYKINIMKSGSEDTPRELQEAIKILEKYNMKVSESSASQKDAVAKATRTRVNTAKRKIEDAVNILRLENKSISEYAIAKQSGCSINTVKKYRDFINAQKEAGKR